MDAVISFFPFLASPEVTQTLVSIALAAVVFFYFVHLLRKEETSALVDEEKGAADVCPNMRHQA
ncbi:hypothetical protein [Noviherbaspirillum sedimenti]|uniref:Uncharacterized protein n=1 Tax=Noviherbaspirillum sedimenti TaxID=2320865 RepID=A0A3A3GI73_9BURK|nr:hypothetical protein [Noviherbaspirillum sedimenti]RJG01976.1 hypothetical protein D3878_10620 [Noviherbaspirillum sedimenti]